MTVDDNGGGGAAAPDDVLGSDHGESSGWLQRRPRVGQVLGVVVLLGVAALVGPDLLSDDDRRADPRPTETSSGPPPTPPGPVGIDWPIRGDLADNPVFVPAALSRVRRDHPDADRVLFAGTLPDGSRVALVAGLQDDVPGSAGSYIRALAVPKDSPIYAGVVTSVGRSSVATDLIGMARRGSGGRVYVVMLARPGPLEAQVSGRADHQPDGGGSREWRDVRGDDGSVVVDVGGRTDPAVFARRTTTAAVPIMIAVDGLVDPPNGPVEIGDADGAGYAGPEAGVLVGAVRDAFRPLMRLADADIRVIWSGDLRAGLRGALLRIRRSDGPAFQLLVGQSATGETFTHGPLRVPWADGDVMPWVFESGDPSRPLLVINPTGRGTASVSYPQEPPRVVTFGPEGTAPLGVGGPSAPRLFGAVIEVRSPAGRVLVKAAVRTVSSEDPLVLDL